MSQTATLRRQLKAQNLQTIHDALSKVSPEQAVDLLENTTTSEGALRLNRTFESGAAALPYRLYAVCHLLHAIGSPLLEEVTTLVLRFQQTEPGILDLALMKAMPNLAVLKLHNAAGLSTLPPLPTLKTLHISGGTGLDLGQVLVVPLEELRLAGVPLDPDALSTLHGQPRLRALSMEGCAGLTSIANLPPSTELLVRDCPDLADLSALQTTMLRSLDIRASVESIALDDAPLLAKLLVEGPRLEGALRLPMLTMLRCDELPDPAPLSNAAALEEVHIGHWPLEDLSPLQGADSLRALRLGAAPTLGSLSTLGGKAKLQSVRITGADVLSALAPLSECATLRQLALQRCPKLTTVEGLRGSPALEEAAFPGCGLLQEVNALETVDTLRRLDLSGCVGLRHLEGARALAALEEIVLPTGRGRSTKVYQGEELDGLQERLRTAHAKRQALEAGDPMVIRVRKLLMHEDLYHQRQALEVMRSFGQDFIDEVLGDCRIEEDGELFTPFGEPSESLLLALSESGKVPQPLKRLVLRGSRFGKLDVLASLPDLEVLSILECPHLTSLAGVERCQKLRRLEIAHCHRLSEITSLRWCRSLETLSITGRAGQGGLLLAPKLNTAALRALETLVYLEHLDLSGCGTVELGVLSKMTRLKTLRATALNPPHGFGRLSALTQLEDIEVHRCELLEDLHALRNMPKLRRLLLGGTRALRDISPIRHLRQLQELNIGGEGIQDASALGALSQLRFLALEQCSALSDLRFLERLPDLETLYLDGCTIQTLRALSAQRALTRITLQNVRHLYTLDGIEACTALKTVEIETGCGALQHADALLELPALSTLRLLEGTVFQVPPEEGDRLSEAGHVRIGPYRARLRAALSRKQRITREAMQAALDSRSRDRIDAEVADLESFRDQRLIDPLIRGMSAAADGRPRGGMLSGGMDRLINYALLEVLRVGLLLDSSAARALASGLHAGLPIPGGEGVPAELLSDRG